MHRGSDESLLECSVGVCLHGAHRAADPLHRWKKFRVGLPPKTSRSMAFKPLVSDPGTWAWPYAPCSLIAASSSAQGTPRPTRTYAIARARWAGEQVQKFLGQ